MERYGIPRSFYGDHKNVYVTGREPPLEEELAGEEALTAFGKACRRLGIEVIAASSPQAKGRVEHSHGVYQDRIVKEIRLQDWSTLEQVNAELASFDADLNRRFAVAPADAEDAHRPLAANLDLAAVLVWEQERSVRNDWTLSYENHWLQILGPKRDLPPSKARVTVQKRLDGSLPPVLPWSAPAVRRAGTTAAAHASSSYPAASRCASAGTASGRSSLAPPLVATRDGEGRADRRGGGLWKLMP